MRVKLKRAAEQTTKTLQAASEGLVVSSERPADKKHTELTDKEQAAVETLGWGTKAA